MGADWAAFVTLETRLVVVRYSITEAIDTFMWRRLHSTQPPLDFL